MRISDIYIAVVRGIIRRDELVVATLVETRFVKYTSYVATEPVLSGCTSSATATESVMLQLFPAIRLRPTFFSYAASRVMAAGDRLL